MALFKKSYRTAKAETAVAFQAEFDRVMASHPLPELAAELMLAFAADGPRRGKYVTELDLKQWLLDRWVFQSRRQRVLVTHKLSGPIREALQILEHAELVYLTVRTDRLDEWRATSVGRESLAAGAVVIRQRIAGRTTAHPPAPDSPG